MNGDVFAVAEALDRAPYHRLLGLDFVSQDTNGRRIRLGLDLRSDLMRANEGGGLHGGAIASLIDVAAYYAVRLAGRSGMTVALSVDYLRPVTGARAEAEGHLVRAGKTQGLADVEVFDGLKLVAVGRARIAFPEDA